MDLATGNSKTTPLPALLVLLVGFERGWGWFVVDERSGLNLLQGAILVINDIG